MGNVSIEQVFVENIAMIGAKLFCCVLVIYHCCPYLVRNFVLFMSKGSIGLYPQHIPVVVINTIPRQIAESSGKVTMSMMNLSVLFL